MADMQTQLLELSNAAAVTAEWMRTHDARANSSDKTLDCLRERLAAPQTASVSSIETRSIVSDWPLPKVAGSVGSGSDRQPSQSHTPSESAGSSQPPGKRQKPSFSPPQKARTMEQCALTFIGTIAFLPPHVVEDCTVFTSFSSAHGCFRDRLLDFSRLPAPFRSCLSMLTGNL